MGQRGKLFWKWYSNAELLVARLAKSVSTFTCRIILCQSLHGKANKEKSRKSKSLNRALLFYAIDQRIRAIAHNQATNNLTKSINVLYARQMKALTVRLVQISFLNFIWKLSFNNSGHENYLKSSLWSIVWLPMLSDYNNRGLWTRSATPFFVNIETHGCWNAFYGVLYYCSYLC